ncbi:hypothetical protein [Nocardioides ungokensis]|uniref:hypothetical protein n=1 Tax=Nocardioides ungokensis TaxID=1643322 RepID=UPI001FE9ABD7|nr:hypothetical protein [Nocardioides ungokensis]
MSAAAAATKALAPSAATRSITGAAASSHRLVVDATGATPRLAWESSPSARSTTDPSRLATYVDARTGQVIRREQQIETVDGQGQTLYSGTVPLSVTQSGSTYQLKNRASAATPTRPT